jgi:peptide subunit release factor 1 (eRF1)
MAGAQKLRRVIDSIAEHPGPMLSAYLSVNAEIPENQERAYLVRLRAAMNERGVPEELQRRIREYVEAETHPRARTLAIFAAEDGFFEVYRIQVDLPESFWWGEPYEAPLLLALEEHEAYGAIIVDAERFRYFVVSPLVDPSEVDNVKGNGYLELDIHPDRPYPRGGRDYEPVSRRTEANVSKYYNQLGELTRDLTFKHEVRRLILAGPQERIVEFRERLPEDVRDRVAAEEHVPLGAPEGELLERLEAARKRAEDERETALLDEIRESGVRGLEDTITALQEENRIYYLAVLWGLEGEIRWSDQDQMAILDVTREKSPYSGSPTRVRYLMDVLVDLAAARGARIDFFTGESEKTDILRDEFGGIAGLTRF